MAVQEAELVQADRGQLKPGKVGFVHLHQKLAVVTARKDVARVQRDCAFVSGDAVLDLMLSLQEETGASLLMVTHSMRLAGRLEARVHLHSGKLA